MTQKTAAICAIALDEGPYIREWLDHHRRLGFAHAYVYDNSADNSLASLAAELDPDFVTIFHFPGACRQLEAYDDFGVARGGMGHAWAAFIDVDEFIVLNKHDTIVDFARDHCPSGSVSLNWYLFGSNGHETFDPATSVRERFTKRGRAMNPHVKSIVHVPDYVRARDPHCFFTRPPSCQKDPRGRVLDGPWNPAGTDEIAHVNHYFVKSREEFERKIRRGRADTRASRTVRDFAAHDLNEVEDARALIYFSASIV